MSLLHERNEREGDGRRKEIIWLSDEQPGDLCGLGGRGVADLGRNKNTSGTTCAVVVN